VSLYVWDGTVEKPGTPTVWDGTVEKPATISFSTETYPTVASMLSNHPFYVAHRGGSLDWPEHSMLAYTNSIAWGCSAVEMSVNRTSDGVWIALHDADLNRTSMTSGLPAVSEMTWQQVQQYRIKVTNGNEPYEKMTDILDRYQSSHIFFLDPKMGYNYRTEFFAIVKSFPNWDKHVMKYFHTGTAFASEARAKGWTTWGYYYQADVPQIPTTSPYWDLLGMDYTASAASWDAINAIGKPVIGHILPNQSAATIALGYGSRGLMCSGVRNIVPHA
jgi:hypothetical protein